MPAVRRGLTISIFSIFLALAFAACGGDDDSSSDSGGETTSAASSASPAEVGKTKPEVVVQGGAPVQTLEKNDLVVGTGKEAKAGDEITVEYVGVGQKSKKEFDTSWGGEPLVFGLGSGLVIPGWEEGIPGMKVGGRRELVIPGELAYGPEGSPPEIGPNETLIFVVDMLNVE
ncbi:MAG: FKBP-type peptidyl-prolyl cis-trans isomerase [Solirubrobacterales bacterium]